MSENHTGGDLHQADYLSLDERTAESDPFRQFGAWFTRAISSGAEEPESMYLSTADKNGIPSGRVVLMKGYDPLGFVFYTSYSSRKAIEIAENQFVYLVFRWKENGRQVRIGGKAEKVTAEESDKYFSTRPYDSRISAVVSSQSSVIPDREYLEKKFEKLKYELGGKDPKRPHDWGGFRVRPFEFEFWQDRPNRLHDRIRYRMEDNVWKIERLAP